MFSVSAKNSVQHSACTPVAACTWKCGRLARKVNLSVSGQIRFCPVWFNGAKRPRIENLEKQDLSFGRRNK